MLSDWNRNIEESLDKYYAAHEALKKEIKDGPAYVAEVYETLQKIGYLRLEARALMLDVRNELLDQNNGVMDPAEYERELRLLTKKPYDLYDVPLVCDAEPEQIGERIRDFFEKTENEEDGADDLALSILPELEECVRNNFYRTSESGIVKPDFSRVAEASDGEIPAEEFIIGAEVYLMECMRFEECLDFDHRILELFACDNENAYLIMGDIGECLENLDRTEECDKWFAAWDEKYPDDPNRAAAYGMILMRRGDFDKAKEVIESALPDTNPLLMDYYLLYDRAAFLYEQLEEMEKAQFYTDLLVELDGDFEEEGDLTEEDLLKEVDEGNLTEEDLMEEEDEDLFPEESDGEDPSDDSADGPEDGEEEFAEILSDIYDDDDLDD